MRVFVILAIVAILAGAAGCSEFTERENCAIEGAEAGILIGAAASGGYLASSYCGVDCVKGKIQHGENPDRAENSSTDGIERDALTIALPTVIGSAVIGAVVGYATCPNSTIASARERATQSTP